MCKTLRRKLETLSQQRQAAQLGTSLARRWLDGGLLQADYLYVDGHVKDYSGTRLVPEVWNSHRRMPLPGIVQYFVNDVGGRPLLVVTEEVRGNLAKSLPKVIAEIRKVLADEHFTVILIVVVTMASRSPGWWSRDWTSSRTSGVKCTWMTTCLHDVKCAGTASACAFRSPKIR